MSTSLNFVDHVDVTSIEERLLEGARFDDGPATAVVDLTAATGFDVVGLLHLLALAAKWRDTGKKIRLKLPHDPHVRHILRQSRFTTALEIVMGMPFRLLVERADLRYFNEDSLPEMITMISTASAQASVLACLVEQHHFGLSAHRIDGQESPMRVLDQEVGHWRSYAMVQLLRTVLRGEAVEVSRVIVQELITNIMEYPAASVAVMASQLELPMVGTEGGLPALTIAAWDDGTSIIETLRTRLASTGKIRAWSPDATDYFVVHAPNASVREGTYRSDWTPEAKATDAELLFASLLPGITQKPVDREPNGPQSSVTQRMDYGYGLFALYKAAIDHFEGSVELRCGRTRLEFTRPDLSGPYQVRVADLPDLEPLTGTVVTVRLPVRDD